MEIPQWLLETIIYAVLTALFTGILAPISVKYFTRYLDERKERKRKEKKELKNRKGLLDSCIWYIETTLEYLKRDSFGGVSKEALKPPLEYEKRINEYEKSLTLCKDLFLACKYVVKVTVEEQTRIILPKTLAKIPELEDKLQKDDFLKRYVNEKEVTKSWMEEQKTKLYRFITRNLQEEEIELNTLFSELNGLFRDNSVMERYRKEKQELIECGQRIIKDLKRESEDLDEKLLQFSDVKERIKE